jgi:preprotein translocase subunit SecE
MGRLQRKKIPNAKKKKNQDSGVTEEAPGIGQKAGKANATSGILSKNSAAKQVPSSKSLSTRKTSEPGKIKALWDKTAQFLREVKIELKKVAWPSRKQTIGSTVVVIILVLIISFFLGAVDVGLAGIIRAVLH